MRVMSGDSDKSRWGDGKGSGDWEIPATAGWEAGATFGAALRFVASARAPHLGGEDAAGVPDAAAGVDDGGPEAGFIGKVWRRLLLSAAS